MRRTLFVFFLVFLTFAFGCGKTEEELAIEAREKLTKLNYKFDQKDFLDAVSRDDLIAVKLFVEAKMDHDFFLNYELKLPESNPLSSNPIMEAMFSLTAQCPLTVAIVSKANQVLAFLLPLTKNLEEINKRIIEKAGGTSRDAGNDLIGMSVLALNSEALSMFLNAGLKSDKTNHLETVVNFASFTNGNLGKSAAEIGNIVAILVNNGQSLLQYSSHNGEKIATGFILAYHLILGNFAKDPEIQKALFAKLTDQKSKDLLLQMMKMHTATQVKKCFAMQRVILGAFEIYNMDNTEMLETITNADVCTEEGKLVAGGYLKTPVSLPHIDCSYGSRGNLLEDGIIICKKHGSIEDEDSEAKRIVKEVEDFVKNHPEQIEVWMPGSTAQRDSEDCYANLREITNAIELYNMDHPNNPITYDFGDPFSDSSPLTAGKYLKNNLRQVSKDCKYFVIDSMLENGSICCTKHGTFTKGPFFKTPKEIEAFKPLSTAEGPPDAFSSLDLSRQQIENGKANPFFTTFQNMLLMEGDGDPGFFTEKDLSDEKVNWLINNFLWKLTSGSGHEKFLNLKEGLYVSDDYYRKLSKWYFGKEVGANGKNYFPLSDSGETNELVSNITKIQELPSGVFQLDIDILIKTWPGEKPEWFVYHKVKTKVKKVKDELGEHFIVIEYTWAN